MSRSITLVLGAVLMVARLSLGQCDDPFDGTLCVYTLTPAQELEFSAVDGAVSPFWADMTGDHLDLIPPDDCAAGSCNFTGVDDASMLVKAAGTRKGIYLYVAVTDNVWVDWSGGDSYGDDSVDFYFDALDANTIFTCTDCLVGLYNSTLSYTTQQFQVFMGAASIPTQFRFAYYDVEFWSWQTLTLTWANAKALYGFEAEIVSVDGVTKVQEWFFPWEKFGGGLALGSDITNRRFGFCGGYNDMDGDNTSPDKLRWPEAGDPWAGDAQTLNYWGDFLTDGSIGTVYEVSVNRPTMSARPVEGGRVASTEYFTLDGQRIAAEAVRAGRVSGPVVERQTLSNGRAVTRRLGAPR